MRENWEIMVSPAGFEPATHSLKALWFSTFKPRNQPKKRPHFLWLLL